MATLKFGNGNWASKKEAVLAYNDENSNFKPLPFTFDRASSATVVNKQGLIETVGVDEPRIDFLNNSKGHLLLEPERTNLIPYSNLDFGTGSVPDGWAVGFGTGTFSHNPTTYKGQPAVIHRQETTGRSYLRVLFVGTNAEHTIRVEFDRSRCLNMQDNDLIVSTVNVTNTTSKRWSDVDANGILEFQTTFGADADGELRIGFGISGNADGDKTLVWGMPQLEQGSYATSYIPTQGSAVTRSNEIVADMTDLQSKSLLGANQGTWFIDLKDMFFEIIGTGIGSMALYLDSGNQIEFVPKTNTSFKITLDNSIALDNISGENKIAISYDGNGLVIYKNGVSAYSTLSTSYSVAYTELHLSENTRPHKININDMKLYNTRLSNSELATLTTL